MYWHKYLRIIKRYKKSSKLIAISEASKNDYLQYMNDMPAEDISVIYHGFGGTVASTDRPSAAAIRMASKPYIMYLGGIDFRKNIAGLLRAFYELKPDFPDLRLVAVGKEFMLSDQLGDVGWNDVLHSNKAYAKDVITPGFASPADMSYLYQHAEALVHPTLYEGFGLPILEAMNEGCPVICYDNSSLPELVGDAALVVKSGTPLAPAVKKLLTTPKLATELRKKGKIQANKFTWTKTASATIDLLVDAAKVKLK
jgi:glycosyltransferase involved in cell wall biosynthesis